MSTTLGPSRAGQNRADRRTCPLIGQSRRACGDGLAVSHRELLIIRRPGGRRVLSCTAAIIRIAVNAVTNISVTVAASEAPITPYKPLIRNRDFVAAQECEHARKSAARTVLPVSAARIGWATWPSFTPFASARPRVLSSSAAAFQSACSKLRRRVHPGGMRASGGQQLSRLRIELALAVRRTEIPHSSQARRGSLRAPSDRASRRSTVLARVAQRLGRALRARRNLVGEHLVVGLANVVRVKIVELLEIEAAAGLRPIFSRLNQAMACSVEMVSSSP